MEEEISLRVRVISIKLQKAGTVELKVKGAASQALCGRWREAHRSWQGRPATCLPGLREARPPSLPLTELTAGHGKVPTLS